MFSSMLRDDFFGISEHYNSMSNFQCNCLYVVFPIKLSIDVNHQILNRLTL